MSVKKIMSSPVLTVKLDDELPVVVNIFSATNFHHLLVVEKKVIWSYI
jgi:predicted transcriptional regulator